MYNETRREKKVEGGNIPPNIMKMIVVKNVMCSIKTQSDVKRNE